MSEELIKDFIQKIYKKIWLIEKLSLYLCKLNLKDMTNLEDLGLVHLDEVGDDKSFIVIVQDEDGFFDVLQGTRLEIIEFIIEGHAICDGEFDSTREILEYCENINGDGGPYIQILSPAYPFKLIS